MTGYPPPLAQQQPPLRERYTPLQIYLYFFPFSDRGPRIKRLQQELEKVRKQIWALALAGLILVVLFLATTRAGAIYLGFLGLACIIGVIVRITWLVKNKFRPLSDELRRELDADAREKKLMRTINPPNERQYDKWIDAIREDIYQKAPGKLCLPEHSKHKTWRVGRGGTEPEKFGAFLGLEGTIDESDAAKEQPPLLLKETSRTSPRGVHGSVYVFTALFITEDYIATYTSIVNLRDSKRDREKFEYGYLQHLSYMLLDVDTITLNIGLQSRTPVSLKQNVLSLTFDSGRTIKRSVLTLHVGHDPVTDFALIHKRLTEALKDHEKSLLRSLSEAKSLE